MCELLVYENICMGEWNGMKYSKDDEMIKKCSIRKYVSIFMLIALSVIDTNSVQISV